jgi:hypothetical protein
MRLIGLNEIKWYLSYERTLDKELSIPVRYFADKSDSEVPQNQLSSISLFFFFFFL